MALFCLSFLHLVSSLVLYHFGARFGQVYMNHYSENSRIALSGYYSSVDIYDIIPTDRGAYFPTENSLVKPYPNEIWNYYTYINLYFTMSTWIMPTGTTAGLIYSRSINSTDQFYIAHSVSYEYIFLKIIQSGISSTYYSADLSAPMNSWKLITLNINNTSVKVYIDATLAISFTLPKPYNEQSSCYYPYIGCNFDYVSFIGYIWYHFHSFSVIMPTSFTGGPSSVCLTPTCTNCTQSVIDPFLQQTGCLSKITTPGLSSSSTNCSNYCTQSTSGCMLTKCLECSCIHGHCKFESDSAVCDCPSTALSSNQSTCLCAQKYYYNGILCVNCNSDCSDCKSSANCTSCVALNSYPGQTGCICKDGFYNVSALVSNNSCLKCPKSCISCNMTSCLVCNSTNSFPVGFQCSCSVGFFNTSLVENKDSCIPCLESCASCTSSSCLTCKSANSVISGNECICSTGYFNTSSLTLANSCILCPVECSSCNSSSCHLCKDSNAIIQGMSCVCKAGFYNITSLEANGACLSCPEDCLTCNLTSCLTCKASNSYVAPSGKCLCFDGFYNISSLISSDSCLPCYSECKTCSSSSSCLTCLVSNASPQSPGCICPLKTFNNGLMTLNSTLCVACLSECASCDQVSSCVTCLDPNSILTSQKRCICKESYFNITQLTTDTSCIKCHSDCLLCNQANICSSCKNALAVPAVDFGCVCSQGYWKNVTGVDSFECVPCLPDCSVCNSASNCIKCKDSSAVFNGSMCECLKGFYGNYPLVSNSSCLKCQQDCLTCNSSFTCLTCTPQIFTLSASGQCECAEGYFKSSTKCEPCHPDCKSCLDINKCETCTNAEKIPHSTAGCTCKQNFYLDQRSNCLPCPLNCDICIQGDSCSLCSTGYKLNQNFQCELGCHSDCLTCENATSCKSCKDFNAEPVLIGCECKVSFYFNSSFNSCEPCMSQCQECNSSETCLTCANNSLLTPYCKECHQNCLNCFGEKAYQCLSCDSLLLNGICTETCPVGFEEYEGVCRNEKQELPTIRFLFQGAGGIYFDSMNNVSGVVERDEGSRRLFDGPTSVFGRGIYFPGFSGIKVEVNDSKLLNNEFSVSIWMKPEQQSAILMKKYDFLMTKTYLQIFLKDLEVFTEISIDGKFFTHRSVIKVKLNYWNHILLSSSFSEGNIMNLWVNHHESSSSNFSDFPFTDSDNSSCYLASDASHSNDFIGFMYSFEIYSKPQKIESLSSETICKSCDLCLVDGTCLSNCLATEYFSSESFSCESCPTACPVSCKDGSTCNLCVDSHCSSCRSFSSSSCFECEDGYELKNSQCIPCSSSEYFSSSSKSCEPCPSLCISCESSTICLSCKENSSLNSLSQCTCNQGYSLTTICQRNYFNASLTVSQKNILTLWFSEPLHSLQKKHLKLHLDKKSVSFELTQETSKVFKIDFDQSNIKKDSSIKIIFLETLISKNNSLLKTTYLEKTLELTEDLKSSIQLEKKAKESKGKAKDGATAGVSIALGISFMNFDPTSFFDFMNTAEMFYSVYLYNLNLNPVLSEFLAGLRIHNEIPKVFRYFIEQNDGQTLSKTYKSYGFSHSLFVLNAAPHLQGLGVALVLAVLVFLITRATCCANKLKFLVNIFKYSFFLRFWLQTFFEIMTAAFVAVKNCKFENLTQDVDFGLALTFLLIECFGIGFFVYLFFRRKALTDQESIKEFETKFGTFFEEFDDKNSVNLMFYFFYIVRRVFIQIGYWFIADGILQLSISIVFSFSIPLYVFATRNFKSSIYNVYHFFNEILIGVYHAVILVSFIEGTSYESQKLADTCITIITVAWALNIVISLFNTVKMIVLKVKDFIRKRKSKVTQEKYVNKTGSELNEHNDTNQQDIKTIELS